jgi:hypothetical protein
MLANVPSCPERDLPDSAEEAARVIADLARGVKNEARFLWARSILKSPAWYAQVSQILRDKHPEAQVIVVDPYTFFGLIKSKLETSKP